MSQGRLTLCMCVLTAIRLTVLITSKSPFSCFRCCMTSRRPNICHHDASVHVHSYSALVLAPTHKLSCQLASFGTALVHHSRQRITCKRCECSGVSRERRSCLWQADLNSTFWKSSGWLSTKRMFFLVCLPRALCLDSMFLLPFLSSTSM